MDWPELRTDQAQRWERLAPWWDERISRDHPPGHEIESLIEIQEGDRALDLGCGSGWMARWMAAAGAKVVAVDVATEFVDRARRQSVAAPAIDFAVCDVTDEGALAELGEASFDKIFAGMVLMNLVELAPAFRGLARVLAPGGSFVATLLHPCFPSAVDYAMNDSATPAGTIARIGNRVVATGLIPRRFVARSARLFERVIAPDPRLQYLEARAIEMMGPGQPVSQWNFHRPLHAILTPAFAAGLVLDGMAESRFGPDLDLPGPPNLLVLRFRKP